MFNISCSGQYMRKTAPYKKPIILGLSGIVVLVLLAFYTDIKKKCKKHNEHTYKRCYDSFKYKRKKYRKTKGKDYAFDAFLFLRILM